jgi:hypothetical protein
MEEEETRPAFGLEAGFQYVEIETVNIGDVAGANAGRSAPPRTRIALRADPLT